MLLRVLFLLGPLMATVGHVPAAGAAPLAWVHVGDPGNAANSDGFGAVAVSYRIAETEVSAEELRREAKWTTAGAWPVAAVEREYRLSEEVTWTSADDRIWHLDDMAVEQERAMGDKEFERPRAEVIFLG